MASTRDRARDFYFECGWGSPPWYRLEGSVEVKSFICRYGPVDCAQAVKGEGLTVGKGVKLPIRVQVGWF